MLTSQWVRFPGLKAEDLYDLIAAREAVFVVEQRCAYQEADGLDKVAWHLVVWDTVDGKRSLAASLRVLDPGTKFTEVSIGRIMTSAAHRGTGLGRRIVKEAVERAEVLYPRSGIRISAQAHLQGFYAGFGFSPAGDPYDEDGILHIDMLKPPVPAPATETAATEAADTTDAAAPASADPSPSDTPGS